MSALEFGIKITAVNAAGSLLRSVRDNIKSIANANREVKKSYDDTIRSLQKTATAALATAGALKLIGKGVKAASDVGESVAFLRAEFAEAGKSAEQLDAEMKSIRVTALKTQAATVFSTKDIMEANVALKKSSATLTDLTDDAEGLSVTVAKVATLMKTTPVEIARDFKTVADLFSDTGKSSFELADDLARASSLSTADFSEMARVIMKTGASLKENVGLQWDDIVRTVAIASRAYVGRPEAMAQQFSKFSDVMQEYGDEAVDSAGNLKSVPELLDIIIDKTKDMTKAQKGGFLRELFGDRVELRNFVGFMLEARNTGQFEEYNEAVEKQAGLNEKVEQVMGSTNKQADALKGTIEGALAESFKDLDRILGDVFGNMNKLVTSFATFAGNSEGWSKSVTVLSGSILALGAGATALFGVKSVLSGGKFLKGIGGVKGLLGGAAGLGKGVAVGTGLKKMGVTPVYVVNANEISGGFGKGTGIGAAGATGKGMGSWAAKAGPALLTAGAPLIAAALVGGGLFAMKKESERLTEQAGDKEGYLKWRKTRYIDPETGEEKDRPTGFADFESEKERLKDERRALERYAEAGGVPGEGTPNITVNTYIDGDKAKPEKVFVLQTENFNRGTPSLHK